MSRRTGSSVRNRAVTFAVFVAVVSLAFLYPKLAPTAAGAGWAAEPQGRTQTGRRRRPAQPAARTPARDYANFSHGTRQHQKACTDCHKFPSKNWKEVRKGDEAFPDVTEFPEHSSCLDCHRQQFFARERPAPRICSNCHVQISPRNTVRFPFPSLTGFIEHQPRGKEPASEFGVNFPHEKHVDIVGMLQPGEGTGGEPAFVNASFGRPRPRRAPEESKSCAVCHQTYLPQGNADDEFVTKRPKGLADEAFWLKKGTFKTAPMNHASCFTCHSQDAGITPAPTDCNICHKLAPPGQAPRADFDPKLAATMGVTDRLLLYKWRRRDSAGAFRHEIHQDQDCANCHNVPAMNTLDPKTLRARVQTCGGEGCHITPTTDEGGILNFEVDQKKAKPGFQCSKCHIVFGKEPVPASHLNAISALNKK